jgi:V8-like Glu-specific endopeptidase
MMDGRFNVLRLVMSFAIVSAGCGPQGEPEALAETTQAIINGTIDSTNTYSNVGMLVVGIAGKLYPICSGTLIAPKVFLTASHCTFDLSDYGVTDVFASFDPEYKPGSKLFRGTAHTHPLFGTGGSDDSHDLAVVVLESAPQGIRPARLPGLNLFEELAANNGLKDQEFVAVGYGATTRTVGVGGPTWEYDDVRRFATSKFNSLNPGWLRLSQNAATGNGGTCYGDSGGPNFLGKTDIIAGDTVTGDTACRSTNVIYRLDTPSAREFLGKFVTLP